MPRKVKPEVSAIRQKQRAHAKRRFSQRFDLELNRDGIREIERMIGSGRAIVVPSKDCHRNYLVGVAGRLIVVGYDCRTHRVVTALPDEYVERLPPETVTLARLRFLSAEQEKVIADILAGKAQLLHIRGGAEFYEVLYAGQPVRIGYRADRRVLVPYRGKPGGSGKPSFAVIPKPAIAPPPVFDELELEPALADSFRRQIKDQQSILLWRHSKSVAFHQVERDASAMRIGYSNTRNIFFQYSDPPESMVELRSSLRLLEAPASVQAAVAELVRECKADLLSIRTEDRASYRVEWNGEIFYLDYSAAAGRLLAWFEGRARPTDPLNGQESR